MIAVSTLHMLMAVPARACPSETMATASAAQAMPMAMPHAGHQMADMSAPSDDQTPAPDAPSTNHKPCCPSPASGCPGSACAPSVAAAIVFTADALPVAPLTVVPRAFVADWVSFTLAPEPPPPRA